MRGRGRGLADQVIVITGASSGIGLATARAAARGGARVVLASRSGAVLETVVREIEAAGGEALAAVADVGVPDDVGRVAAAAVRRFGRIDCWVNNAGVAAYSTLADLPLDEHRRIFETNYWGVVHGSLAAVAHFRRRAGGGTLINVGSVNSDVSIPLLSAYSASKHAVKGFTDALRLELLAAGDPIRVTLIKPSGIATPFPQHARNHLPHEPRVLPPLYAPELVAEAILHAAVHPAREVTVGSVGRVVTLAAGLAPRLTDRLLAAAVPPVTASSHPRTLTDNLDAPTADAGRVHYPYFSGLPVSPLTRTQARALTVLAAGIGLLAVLGARRARRPRR